MESLKVAIYARFSSDNQNPKSITDQYRKCEEKIATEFGDTTEIFYYKDEAISGTNNNRPEYLRMINDGVDGKFEVLLIDDLSRLSRDTLESHRILKQFRFHGIRIIAVADGIDTSHEGYKLHAGLKALINEEYIDALSKKTYRGMEGRALENKHCGGRTYGYDVVSLGEDEGSILKVNPEQAKWVKQVFEWYADGYSPRWIAATLNEMGVPSPRKGKKTSGKWSQTAIYGHIKRGTGMLNCQTYIGRVIWNKRKWLKTPEGKRVARNNPESEWKIQIQPELQVIDDILWQRVKNRQKKIHEKSKNIRETLHKDAQIGRGPKYLLSGMMTCGECGANYIVVNRHDYGCSTHRNKGNAACSNNLRVRRDLLESRIFSSLKEFLFTPTHLTTFEQVVKKTMKEAIKAKQSLNDSDEQRLNEVEKQIENLVNAIKMGIVTPSVQGELRDLEHKKAEYAKRVNIEWREIDQIHAVMPEIKKSFTDILNSERPVPREHVAKLRSRLQMILGQSIRLSRQKGQNSLMAEISSQYSGLLKLSGLSDDKLNMVAGGRFGIKSQDSSDCELNVVV